MLITEDTKLTIEKAKLYLDGLVKYSEETHEDEWVLIFLQSLLGFKTNMDFKYPDAHHFGNKYMREKLCQSNEQT